MAGVSLDKIVGAYQERKRLGKCTSFWCENDAHHDGKRRHSKCLECKLALARKRQRRVDDGLCVHCETPLPADLRTVGIHVCDACHKRRRANRLKASKRKRKGKALQLCSQDGCNHPRHIENGHTFSHCLKHLTTKALAVNKLRDERKESGLCPRCGKVPENDTIGGRPVLWCRTCRARARGYKKEAPVDADAQVV